MNKKKFIFIFVFLILNTFFFLLFKSSPYSKEHNSCLIEVLIQPRTSQSNILTSINNKLLNEFRALKNIIVQNNYITISLKDKLYACESIFKEIKERYRQQVNYEKNIINNKKKYLFSEITNDEFILLMMNDHFEIKITKKEEKNHTLNNFYIINLFLVINICLYIFLFYLSFYKKNNYYKIKKFLKNFFN